MQDVMNYRPTAAVYTLGCRVNQYESEAVAAFLRGRGIDAATSDTSGEVRDIYIVNTCAVTAESSAKSRKLLRRLRRINPDAVIAAVGCDAQLEPDAISSYADIVCGSRGKLDAAAHAAELAAARAAGETAIQSPPASGQVSPVGSQPIEHMSIDGFTRTRAYIKIEDGCNGRCAYCIIPSLRGRVSSRPQDEVTAEVAALAMSGCREVVLTGIETSAYEYDLPELIKRIGAIDGIKRIRLGSLDPAFLIPATAERFAALPKLMPHFHVSLQSGSSHILAAMRRRYGAEQALDNLLYMRQIIPDVKFTADILTCFPGECDADFEDTLEFARRADFYHMHVFTYSPRPGTEAANLPELEPPVRAEHSAKLLALDAELRFAHHIRAVEHVKPLEILFEQTEGGYLTGHTREFMEAAILPGSVERGEIKRVLPVKAEHGFVFCKLI